MADAGAAPEVFKREILPRLRDVPLSTMARVTGFSLGYCSFIRRGLRVPHPRHWTALMDAAGIRREAKKSMMI